MQEESIVFWRLVEENRVALWRFTLGLTRDREAARDLVSEVVLAAHRSFPNLKNHEAFRKSLYTIAVRIYRRQQWRRRIFADPPPEMDWPIEHQPESQYDLELLMAALNDLPQKQREAILLFEISGFSLEEIRVIQGGTLSGVKSRLKRAREVLRRRLTETTVARLDTTSAYASDVVPVLSL